MPDFFDDLKNNIKKDLAPIFLKYFNDPNNKISDKLNNFINDPHYNLTDFFDKFSKNKDNDEDKIDNIIIENNFNDDSNIDSEYDELLNRLTSIEENMIKLKNILRDKN